MAYRINDSTAHAIDIGLTITCMTPWPSVTYMITRLQAWYRNIVGQVTHCAGTVNGATCTPGRCGDSRLPACCNRSCKMHGPSWILFKQRPSTMDGPKLSGNPKFYLQLYPLKHVRITITHRTGSESYWYLHYVAARVGNYQICRFASLNLF